MIRQIKAEVYRKIREWADISHDDIAEEIGTKDQVPWRWESAKHTTIPKPAQEEALVKLAKLTRPAFVEIMCEVLTEFCGRRVTMAPSDEYMPSLPLARARRQFSLHRDDLTEEEQEIVQDMLTQGRINDAATEQTCILFEKQILRIIERARERKRRRQARADAG